VDSAGISETHFSLVSHPAACFSGTRGAFAVRAYVSWTRLGQVLCWGVLAKRIPLCIYHCHHLVQQIRQILRGCDGDNWHEIGLMD